MARRLKGRIERLKQEFKVSQEKILPLIVLHQKSRLLSQNLKTKIKGGVLV